MEQINFHNDQMMKKQEHLFGIIGQELIWIKDKTNFSETEIAQMSLR